MTVPSDAEILAMMGNPKPRLRLMAKSPVVKGLLKMDKGVVSTDPHAIYIEVNDESDESRTIVWVSADDALDLAIAIIRQLAPKS
jgi:hypothetical protein